MWPGVDAGDAAADANGLGKDDASAPCGDAGAVHSLQKQDHWESRPAAKRLGNFAACACCKGSGRRSLGMKQKNVFVEFGTCGMLNKQVKSVLWSAARV